MYRSWRKQKIANLAVQGLIEALLILQQPIQQFINARKILITADGGGSNSSRGKLWETELQRLASETGLGISVCHFPPRTSKWNKIEHRLFQKIGEQSLLLVLKWLSI
jgi:hypothetical protein